MSDFPATGYRKVLALHGFTGAGADFEAFQAALPGTWRWETPDLPPLPLDALCRFLRERWDALAGAPRVLLGYSMGGRIALHLAREIFWGKDDVLVLISASPGLSDVHERKARQASDELLAKKIEAAESAETFYAEWQKVPLIATQCRLASPWRERLLARRAQADKRVWAAHLRELGTGTLPSLWENLSEIAAPKISLVFGEEDSKFRAIAEKMHARMPRSRLVVIPACGHSPHLENPSFAVTVQNVFLTQSF